MPDLRELPLKALSMKPTHELGWGDTLWSPDSFRVPENVRAPRSVAPPQKVRDPDLRPSPEGFALNVQRCRAMFGAPPRSVVSIHAPLKKEMLNKLGTPASSYRWTLRQ